MATLISGSDAPVSVDDRAESPPVFGTLDSLASTRDGYVMVPYAPLALLAGSDAPVSVDDRVESPAVFGTLDSLTSTRDGYVTVGYAAFALTPGLWLQPDGSAADTQGSWGVVA